MKITTIICVSLVAGLSLSCDNATVENVSVYYEGLLPNVTPKGWIREYLERQVSGLTGHPDALSYPYNTNLWNGEIERMSDHGRGWWRYEQTAYYSDGLLRLGYALKDSVLINKVEEGINYTINNASPDGYIGSNDIRKEPSRYMWPQAVFFRAMQAMFECTGQDVIPQTLARYYKNYTADQIAEGRNIVNIEGLLWVYGKTHDESLLALAKNAYSKETFELLPKIADIDGCPHMHGVTYCEQLKIPELLYAWTGNQEYLRIAHRLHQKLVDFNMLPDGVPTSAEFLMGNNVNCAHETCDIADFSWTEGYFLMTEGLCEYADRIEKAVFNAAPGCVTKDFKALQYFSNINQFACTGDGDPNQYKRGMNRNAYRPTHETECCAGNVHRIMPNYVSRMWMKDKEGDLVASLYGPSEIDTDKMKIEEITQYPFRDTISFLFHPKTNKKSGFSFRIPLWCRDAIVRINGTTVKLKGDNSKYHKIYRRFKDGDRIDIILDMPVRVTYPNAQGVSFERGPVLFSYPIPEKWEEDKNDYPQMRGKKSENPDFKCWNITPAGPYNYAFDEPHYHLNDLETSVEDYPFDNPPYSISVAVKQIDWALDEGKYTPVMPKYGVKELTKEWEIIDLIPYGCTQLRLTVFPILPPSTVPIQDF